MKKELLTKFIESEKYKFKNSLFINRSKVQFQDLLDSKMVDTLQLICEPNNPPFIRRFFLKMNRKNEYELSRKKGDGFILKIKLDNKYYKIYEL